jgi:hypothetical protein
MRPTYSPKVSPSRIRKPTVEDRFRIYCQLEKAVSAVPGADITKLSDTRYATEMVVKHGVPSLILDEAYLVVYQVGSPWYSDRVFLQENLVLRIGKGSAFAYVCDLLDDLAEQHNANDILVGGALSKYPRALTRLYKSRGYELLSSPSLIKRR